MIAKVLIENVKGKALIEVGDSVYITPSRGYHKNEEFSFDEKNGIKVPSQLFGIAMLFNDDFDEAIKFIKENW